MQPHDSTLARQNTPAPWAAGAAAPPAPQQQPQPIAAGGGDSMARQNTPAPWAVQPPGGGAAAADASSSSMMARQNTPAPWAAGGGGAAAAPPSIPESMARQDTPATWAPGAAAASAGGGADAAANMARQNTPAPWAATPASGRSSGASPARSPATSSHFPQLARPTPEGGVVAANALADTMSPTAAPWSTGELPQQQAPPPTTTSSPFADATARAAAVGRPAAAAGALSTGRPIEALIDAQPALPPTLAAPPPGGFVTPAKRITSDADLKRFLASDAARGLVAFLLALNQAVTGKKLSEAAAAVSPPVAALRSVLETLWVWVDEVPPVAQPLRYGNPAYRAWAARLSAHAAELMARVLPPELAGAAVELGPYLADSFGNATRIDYGTGHETTFAVLLYALAALGVVTQADAPALVAVVFSRYVELMRRVQTTYWLEPAGSHGVWGLDDYQFLAFVFGSAQLVGHPMIRPKSIASADVLEAYSSEYMYLRCVQFVLGVKKGPLHETSPMLNDISAVPSWAKVNSGLIKMYQVEVLSKLPIMQHLMFGSLLRFE